MKSTTLKIKLHAAQITQSNCHYIIFLRPCHSSCSFNPMEFVCLQDKKEILNVSLYV